MSKIEQARKLVAASIRARDPNSFSFADEVLAGCWDRCHAVKAALATLNR